MARAEYHIGLQTKVIIIMIVLLLQSLSSHGCLEEESFALTQLLRSFYNRTVRLQGDCCEWESVLCNDTTGRVTELYLDNLYPENYRDESLGGWNFNASLFLPFEQLRILDLSSKNIICSTESEGFAGLRRLSNLEALNLDYNGLSNNVLPMFKGFQSLKILSLSYNKLNGTIHVKDLANIPKLEELHLSGNNIAKFVSSKDVQNSSNISTLWLSSGVSNGSRFELQSLKGFQNLKSLRLESNNFNGMLFLEGIEKLQILSNLEALYLDYNGSKCNAISMLRGFQYLKNLTLVNTTLSGLLHTKDLSNFKNLKLLDLSYSVVGNSFLHSITNITSLEALRLRGCKLNNSIADICKLKNLQGLDLHENGISGNLSLCLANLTNLKYLDISSNYFTENISESPLKSLTSIEYLNMSNNQFRVPISLSPFFNHSKLKYMDANGNEIYAESDGFDDNMIPKFQLEELFMSSTYGEGGASFPRFLYHQHELRHLNFSGIQMRGVEFPNWLLDNNMNLEGLDLKNCSLSGTLHLPIHPHAKLIYLDISNNLFYGHVPASIGGYFPMIDILILARNDFIGKIPNSLSICSLLTKLDLRHNRIFGNIPDWIGNMSSLLLLDLSNNTLFGNLPSLFIPPQALHIYLSHNNLEGPFPHILPYSDVITLDLSHNCLTGAIPNSIENLYRLRYILLSHNKFEGEIPPYLWKMMNQLKFVDLSCNRLGTLSFKNRTYIAQGYDNVPFYSEILELVVKGNTYQYDTIRVYETDFIGLDLSNNKLACSIPFEIGNKKGTKMLNLSCNHFVGQIPLSFFNMTEVESLDLSHNNLSGTLPSQLILLKSLEVFSVAYNNFSGKTPERVAQFATFEESSYEGNPFLCGEPLPKTCTPTILSTTNESSTDYTNDDGFIDMEVFQISFWVTFIIIFLAIVSILYLNPYWRQAWFYFFEVRITSCYYFLVDHLPFLSKFRIT